MASKTSKVFGVGWAKTGTTTLGECLAVLGYKHQSQDREAMRLYAAGCVSEVVAKASEHDSFEDWPWLLLYKELDRAYPGSRFVLTTRDPDRWLRSYRMMLSREGLPTDDGSRMRTALYGLPFPDVTDEALKRRFREHNSSVQAYFTGRDDLLVVNWEMGHGWQELCEFLGKDVPALPFPHANRAPA